MLNIIQYLKMSLSQLIKFNQLITNHSENVGSVGSAFFVGAVIATQDKADGETEIGAKDVDQHRSADVGDLQFIKAEPLIGRKDGDLADGHNDQLQRRSHTENGTEGDEHAG